MTFAGEAARRAPGLGAVPPWWELAALALLSAWAGLAFIIPTHLLTTDQINYLAAAEALLREGRLETIDGEAAATRPLLYYATAGLLALDDDLGAYAAALQAGSFAMLAAGYLVLRGGFGATVALAALALFASSPVIAFASARHIDAWPPALILLALAVWAPRPRAGPSGPARPVIAGVIFAAAFAFKEVFLVFAPFWLLAAWRSGLVRHRRGLVAFYVTAGLGCLSALIWSRLAAGTGDEAAPASFFQLESVFLVLGAGDLRAIVDLLAFPFVGLWRYVFGFELYPGRLTEQPLTGPGLAALGWIVWTARTSAARFNLAALAGLCLPILVLAGDWQLRPGQTLLFDLILRAALAVALVDIARHAAPAHAARAGAAVLACAMLIGAMQWLVENRGERGPAWRQLISTLADDRPVRWRVASRGAALAERFAGADGAVMVEPAIMAESMYRLDDRFQAAYALPWRDVTLNKNFIGAERLLRPLTAPVYVKPLWDAPEAVLTGGLYVLDLSDIARRVRRDGVRWVLLQQAYNPGLEAHLATLGVDPMETVRDGREFAVYDAGDLAALAGRWTPEMMEIRPGVCRWLGALSRRDATAARRSLARVERYGPEILDACAARGDEEA